MTEHADAGPSSAETWIACPASVTQARGKKSFSNAASRGGTAKHEVSQIKLEGKIVPPEIIVEGDVFKTDEAFMEPVDFYVDYAQMAAYKADFVGVEKRVTIELDGVKEPVFGTVDLLHYHAAAQKVGIKDAKFGMKDVQIGPQPMIYALGALQLPEMKGKKVTTVELGIIQPAVRKPIKVREMPVEELYAWRDEVLVPALQRIDANDPTENPGSHCHWCRRKAECGAMRARALDKARAAFAAVPLPKETLPMPEIEELLNEADIIESWIAGVRQEAERRIREGERVKGWKLAPTRPTRKWKDEDAAASELLDAGFTDPQIYTEPSLRSPAQIEKLLKKTGIAPDMLEPLISSESSGVKLVRSDEADPASSFLRE